MFVDCLFSIVRHILFKYTVCPEKRGQNVFFVISSTNLGRFWRNLVTVSGINLLQNDVNVSHLTSWGEMNSGVSFCKNSTVACGQWAFQVSQGSVETLFMWDRKRLHHYKAHLFTKRCTKFHQNRPSFVGDITKKRFGVCFSCTQCRNRSVWHAEEHHNITQYYSADNSRHPKAAMLELPMKIAHTWRRKIHCSPCNRTTWSERRVSSASTSFVCRNIGRSPLTGLDSSQILHTIRADYDTDTTMVVEA